MLDLTFGPRMLSIIHRHHHATRARQVRQVRLLVLALFALACASPRPAQVSGSGARPAVADDERWDRRACLRGEYPYPLDGRAYARARQDDLATLRAGASSNFAVSRLISEREAFDRRCESWR
jgi:hypothetical protein